MFGLLFTLIFGVSDEIRIRKDIKNEQVESAKRCADLKNRMNQWEELRKTIEGNKIISCVQNS